ncbi:general substrate transporter [Pyrenochaeta sp. MPI-SDFR-AT-0127]|nr:general substrate transporter [Pyrenochaeta sp. MPI-SDFR-AT-0127]
MFLAGRFFAGMSSFGYLVLTPIYCTELAPPKYRGFFVGLNAVFIATGYSIAAWTGVGFSYSLNPTTQWRGPLGMYLPWPALLMVIAFFSPESPRWLMLQGREEEARKVIFDLHTVKGDDLFASQEFEEIKKQTVIDQTLETSWLSMFTKPSYRRRVAITCFYSFLGQSTAILVINNYGPTFYSALGFEVRQQLFLQAGWVSTAIPSCLLGAFLADIIGRKPIMLLGIGGCCACLIIEAASVKHFTDDPTRKPIGILGTVALYLFVAVYNLGVDVGGNVFFSEVFPNHIRSKGVALANLVLALADLVYLQVTPYAFANIGWKFFLVFIIISGLGFFVLIFTLPETKGLPLEELGKLFHDDPATIAALSEGANSSSDDHVHEMKVHDAKNEGSLV